MWSPVKGVRHGSRGAGSRIVVHFGRAVVTGALWGDGLCYTLAWVVLTQVRTHVCIRPAVRARPGPFAVCHFLRSIKDNCLAGCQLSAVWSLGTLSGPPESHPWQGADSFFAHMDGENSLLAWLQHLHLALVCVLGSSAFGSPS